MPPPSRRRYDRVAGNEEDVTNERDVEEANETTKENDESQELAKTTSDGNCADFLADKDDGTRINVVVLDPAHNRFTVPMHPSWTIARFKAEGTKVHKIADSQQRLVYMGRMLADDTILNDAGIIKENAIVHLFPKPRVVLNSDRDNHDADDCEPEGRAHVPRIVLDPQEAEMRSSILVLGSVEVAEAQNNVKLLSFLLLIVSSMELLALFTIMIGVPQDDQSGSSSHSHDDYYPNGTEIRTWKNSDYFDLILNLFGFYSATLGIKATTDNTRALAKRYMICTYICGVIWVAFYYIMNYDTVAETEEKRREESDKDDMFPYIPETRGEMMLEAFFSVLLPLMVWCLCFYRARRFHQLLVEAEQEAEERIQTELNLVDSVQNSAANSDNNDHDEELALQQNRAN